VRFTTTPASEGGRYKSQEKARGISILVLVVFVVWFEVGRVFVVAPNELVPILVITARLEFAARLTNGFQECGAHARKGGGLFWVDAAFGESTENASERVSEGGGGYKIPNEGGGDLGGGRVRFLAGVKLAVVVITVNGFALGAKHTAVAAIGVGESARRRAVFGGLLGHTNLQREKD
jgi:hypothetical protein